MYNKLIDISFDTARRNFLKELDTAGPIGQLWIEREHSIVPYIFAIMEFIDTYNNAKELPKELVYMPLLDELIFNSIIGWNLNLPTAILLHSELDWNLFVSSEIIFLDYACQLTLKLLGQLKTPDTESEIIPLEQKVMSIGNSFQAALQLLEIGASYSDLIMASNSIVKELKMWQESRPTALQLSSAYLEAIGYKQPNSGPRIDCSSPAPSSKPDTYGPGPQNPPPPPSPPGGKMPPAPHPIECEKK